MNTNRRARLTLIAAALTLLLTVAPPAWAQADAGAPRKVDEFGDIQYSDLIARLDNFAIAIQQEPGSRGFVMAYRTRRDLPGLNSRMLDLIKNYLVNERGLDPRRVVTVDGGEASCLTQELWLAPEGTAPARRAGAYHRDFVDTGSARKFDEYYYHLPSDDVPEVGGYYMAGVSLEAFAAELRKEPRSLAHVIAYPQYYVERWDEHLGEDESSRVRRSRTHFDPPGTAAKMLREVSAALIKEHRIPRSRIRLVNGGHRRSRALEFWIVPRGEHAPVPTPNSFPGRRRKR